MQVYACQDIVGNDKQNRGNFVVTRSKYARCNRQDLIVNEKQYIGNFVATRSIYASGKI
jgi:hypothetical protein